MRALNNTVVKGLFTQQRLSLTVVAYYAHLLKRTHSVRSAENLVLSEFGRMRVRARACE